MANPATITDIEARWRPLTDAETTTASFLLGDAWEIVTSRVPTVDARLADASLSEGLVVQVVSAMVIRVLRNPEGKRSEQIDDYAYTRDASVAGGGLYLSEEEERLLLPATLSAKAFTVTPTWEAPT